MTEARSRWASVDGQFVGHLGASLDSHIRGRTTTIASGSLSEPVADPLEFRNIDQVLRATGGSLVGDEVIEPDHRDGHAKELLRHSTRAGLRLLRVSE